MTTQAKIAQLREDARLWFAKSNSAMAYAYDAEAKADRLEGNLLVEEFHLALAACYRDEPGAVERKDRAYAALTLGNASEPQPAA